MNSKPVESYLGEVLGIDEYASQEEVKKAFDGCGCIRDGPRMDVPQILLV